MENSILDHLKCNENTLRKVLTELVKKGILTRKGNGKTNPAIFNLKTDIKTEIKDGSKADQKQIKSGSNEDQAKTLDKSKDTEKFDPLDPIISDIDKDKLDQDKEDQDKSLDPVNTLITNNGSNIAQTFTESNDPLEPSLAPTLDPLDPLPNKTEIILVLDQINDFIDYIELSVEYFNGCNTIKLKSILNELINEGICVNNDLDSNKFKLTDSNKKLDYLF